VIEYRTQQTPQFGKMRDPGYDGGDLVFAVPGSITPLPPQSAPVKPSPTPPVPRPTPPTVVSAVTLSGTVTDASGLPLPGVTVEASSPVLIERVRTAVTDESGRYRVVDLRPGTYSVTFTLPGFTTFKREGIELSGSMTVTVNAQLTVGRRADRGAGTIRTISGGFPPRS
jgi:hypothetical protein